MQAWGFSISQWRAQAAARGASCNSRVARIWVMHSWQGSWRVIAPTRGHKPPRLWAQWRTLASAPFEWVSWREHTQHNYAKWLGFRRNKNGLLKMREREREKQKREERCVWAREWGRVCSVRRLPEYSSWGRRSMTSRWHHRPCGQKPCRAGGEKV